MLTSMFLKRTRMAILAILVTMGTMVSAEAREDRETLFNGSWEGINFGIYCTLGGGMGIADSEALYPRIHDTSLGLVISPWFSFGGFTSLIPLSNFDDARFGLSLASVNNAFALRTGTEFLFTPWSEKLIHPLIRLEIGGETVGYLVDADDKEGFESATTDRYFYAGINAGPEINISKHTSFYMYGGWTFSGNGRTIGLDPGELGGFTAGAGIKLSFASTIR